MSQEFKLKTYNENDGWILTIAGPLNEHVKLPQAAGTTSMRIDLKGLTYINSIGIRIWVEWLKRQSARPMISLLHCPFVLTKHFSVASDVLPSNVRVESFFVPYLGQDNERGDVLFSRGNEFDDDGEIRPPVVKDRHGLEMELDVLPSYFRFLKR